jgi:hypothetical protein
MKHPIQPLAKDKDGVLRFKENAIVRHLLDHGGIDLNKLAVMDFGNDDRIQFAQLIGYSLSGFGELSYVDNESYEAAELMSRKKITAEDARAKTNATLLTSLRKALREPMSELYGIHPDDLSNRED